MTAAMQQALAIASVLGAALYLARRGWRTWRAATERRRNAGCGPDCGC